MMTVTVRAPIAAALMAASIGVACERGAPVKTTPAMTLALVNGHIWTGDPSRPEAEAVGIAGDRIAAVGTTDDIRKAAGAAETIDLHGQFVTPGFIDSHVHFLEGGFRLTSVQLRDAKTREEFVSRIERFAATVPKGTWITGGDWDHTLWGGELPRRDWIDAVTPDHPVWVNRLDGHMALANTAALRAAGISDSAADVAGGDVERDANGHVTGLLKDNAMDLVTARMPPPSAEQNDRALDAAMKYVAEQGVTAVHHMGTWDDLDVFERAWRAGRLTTRIQAAVPLATWERLVQTVASRRFGADGHGDSWLRVGVLKGFVDGSLGSHTAAFFEPFTDAPKDRGLFVTTPEDLYKWISGADRAGLYVAVHAIGDRAVGTILDIFERVEREDGPRDRRFRIEHAQHLRPGDIPRFRQLNVIASMQPYHAIDDGRWAERIIGPVRIRTTYAFRSLLDAGARLAFGSDWYVAPPTPLEGIYAAVTRRTLDDKHPDGWVPDEKITVDAALRAYTSGGAYASFREHDAGTIAPGMLADLTVIDRDLRAIPPEQIRDAHIVRTIVGGKTVFSRR
ncbi:MAG TPA: amidohydrolase [Vicinamibacterales bacterium]|jgi:predicted amidohydrolase YtcJ|nr:amidohydrolase [Vicinamibacterales bacterium]